MFLRGVRVYVKDLFIKKNVLATVILFVSLILSMYFSLIVQEWIWSIVFCFVQLNAIAYFFFRTSAIGKQQLKWMWKMLCSCCTALCKPRPLV